MIIMPSNNVGPVVRKYFKKYPKKIAQLMSPDGWRPPKHTYALDNGCFNQFDEPKYFKMLENSLSYQKPLFLVYPDVVGCHHRTIALWKYYSPMLDKYKYPKAFVAQDGCTLETVPSDADWIFVGGTDPWKMENIKHFIGDRPVHVGRVNGIGRLKYCESLGVASVDGTGWLRQRNKQFWDFVEYFEGSPQCSLF